MGAPEESITELNSSKSEGQEEEQQNTTWIEDADTNDKSRKIGFIFCN